jgi:hypothetical protein
MPSQVVINDVTPREQIVSAGQLVFNTLFTADAASDIDVYRRTPPAEADDFTQIVNPLLYVVTFVGASQTTRVTFLSLVTAGDIITIARNTPSTRANLYVNTNFTPSMLNEDFGLLTLIDQQNQMYDGVLAPHYNVSAIIAPVDALGGQDIILPVLAANQVWVKNSLNTEITAQTLGSFATFNIIGTQNQVFANGTFAIPQGGVVTLTLPQDINFTANFQAGTVQLNTSNGLLDANGNIILAVQSIPLAVNYWEIVNATAAFPQIVLAASGLSPNIDIGLQAQGTGALTIATSAPTMPLQIFSGTLAQHTTIFAFSNTAAVRTVTFPDASGTVAFVGGSGVIQTASIAGTSQAAAVNTRYIVANAGATTITLPATFAIGDVVIIKGLGAGGWILTANTGDVIRLGTSVTSSGGTLTSANQYDTVYVSGLVANDTWSVDYVLSTGLTVA